MARPLVSVTEQRGAKARGHIDIAVTIDVEHVRAERALIDDRGLRDVRLPLSQRAACGARWILNALQALCPREGIRTGGRDA